jgi:hypothetical protein
MDSSPIEQYGKFLGGLVFDSCLVDFFLPDWARKNLNNEIFQ